MLMLSLRKKLKNLSYSRDSSGSDRRDQKENIKTLEGTDVDGVAVVSAIFAAKDIKKDTKQLRSLVEEMKQK